jgi:hypothetical protein
MPSALIGRLGKTFKQCQKCHKSDDNLKSGRVNGSEVMCIIPVVKTALYWSAAMTCSHDTKPGVGIVGMKRDGG